MKIKNNGIVSFSLRKNDFDLVDFIEAIPDGAGSDVLRELLRNGMEYQRLVSTNSINPNYLSLIIERLKLTEHLMIDTGDRTVDGTFVETQKKATTKKRTKKSETKPTATKPEQQVAASKDDFENTFIHEDELM